ncbi:hypothetical protein C6341_g15432 [Phytophthora cactorum]|nr:hypothetical protein C6341_g15432 [Phytophthora cactorum]
MKGLVAEKRIICALNTTLFKFINYAERKDPVLPLGQPPRCACPTQVTEEVSGAPLSLRTLELNSKWLYMCMQSHNSNKRHQRESNQGKVDHASTQL